MGASKVVFGGETVIDLTSDTVTPETLAEGVTAHNAAGEQVTGTMPTTAVLYTPQTLTEAQKSQARTNIGVVGTGEDGYTPVKGVDYFTASDKAEFTGMVAETVAETLPSNQTLINNVVEKVPIVKVAQQPEFVNDISECKDTSKMYVLPNGHLCAYMTKTVTTEPSTVQNFTNIVSTLVDIDGSIYNGKGYKENTRLSSSAGTAEYSGYISTGFIPFQKGDVIRTKGLKWISDNGAGNGNYSYVIWYNELGTENPGSTRCNQVTDGVSSQGQFVGVTFTEEDGIFTVDTTNWNNNYYKDVKYMRISGYGDGNEVIVTKNQPITYTTTEGGTETVTEWIDTGIEYNQPADYADRVVAVEQKTAKNTVDIASLENKIVLGNAENTSLTLPAYAPIPQLPADGSEGADFNLYTLTTQQAYDYMNSLAEKHTTYVHKQNLGKDASGEYDYFRYVLSKSYWKAWYKENYPRMFAWKNGSTVVYSLSCSPRINDVMYSTGYIGTVYGNVTAVNCDTISASTRTVNGLVFERYATGDIEPTIFYTKPRARNQIGTTLWCEIFNSNFTSTYKGSYDVHDDYMISTASDNNTKYIRYPFEDRKADKSKPIPVFIMANEHGQNGDNRCPSVVLMRMVKDLCENNNKTPFLNWLKENCILTVIPVANPWGYESYLNNRDGYCNANYVNINRNYDTPGWANFENTTQWEGSEGVFSPGEYVGSENETQYIMNSVQLSKAQVAISMHGIPFHSDNIATPYNATTPIKGCGFDTERIFKVEETLFNDYDLALSYSTEEEQNYNNCAKSCAYFEYIGAVGGMTETLDFETGTTDRYTAKTMEQGYTELLLVLQNWIEEALLKNSN